MKSPFILVLIIAVQVLVGFLGLSGQAFSQGCQPIPVDFRGQPSGIYDTTGIIRSNQCCGNNSCVQFDVRLDSKAIGFRVEITTGAIPGGSITYQIDCSGNPRFPGNTVCVGNKDSFSITFCKPGNNPNGYRIISKQKPQIKADSIVYDGCSALMVADSLIDSTIRWSAVGNKPSYDSFLSCISGCDSTNINLQKGYPDSIRYQVRGVPSYKCATDTIYDTVTVQLRDSLSTEINFVNNNLTCSGHPDSATLKAETEGGEPPYDFKWNTNDITQTIQTDTGQYSVSVKDQGYCRAAKDTFQINPKAIKPPEPAIIGKDTICGTNDTILFHTVDSAANTYQWAVSGNGKLVNGKNQDSVKIQWTNTGQGTLQLTQTNQAGCDSVLKDTILVSPYPSPTIQGKDSVCAFTDSYQYQTPQKSGHAYQWAVTNGAIKKGSGSHDIEIQWQQAGSGSVSVTETGINGCRQTHKKAIAIQAKPNPLIQLNN